MPRAYMALRFGFSPKTWSDYTLGKSWMSRAAFAAVVTLLLESNEGLVLTQDGEPV
jgi:hypothetical protein